MRKFASAALLLSLLLTTILYSQAQTRPRRVGQSSSQQQQQQPATQDTATPAPSPRQRPVLQTGTTISSSNRQPAPQSSSKTSGYEGEDVDEGDVVRVNTTLVSIPVTVMDRNGRFIPNLRQQDFRIYEDAAAQQVAYFAPVETPFTLALVIDTSASTRFRLEEIQDAAFAFINQLRPDDRVLVVSFDEELRVLTPATNDRARLRDAISRVRTGGGTKLYDAMDLVINRLLSREQGRKAVVLFTDGVDTNSTRASYQSNVRDAEELDALIYPIQYDTSQDVLGSGGGGGGGYPYPNPYPPTRRRYPRSSTDVWVDILGGIFGGGRSGGRRGGGGGGIIIGGGGGGTNGSSPEDYRRANSYLNDLAYKTGARVYRADTTRDLSQSFALIAEELRRQYSLGYYPKDVAQAGQRRQIRVRVNRPDLVVRARDSYIAGSQPGDATAQQRTNTQQPKPELRRFPLAGTR